MLMCFFFKQKTAYEMRISDWSSDVCSSDLMLVMYLFGTPGQERFGFMWDDICSHALGAVVLVDTDRLDQSFPAVDYFEAKDIPFVVAVNRSEVSTRHDLGAVREALGVNAHVTMAECHARDPSSAKAVRTPLPDELANSTPDRHTAQ